ncbi:hypothetical protein GE061_001655 [Apolygus lucorum]|uniref:Uncharacterized protein n=1 Tax=Apolygus lucorum TaxID=248454 RepID=A0A6A4KFU3_APOLU|nr:hypothetical protein GE061_001655 [Apolygus lucorum]
MGFLGGVVTLTYFVLIVFPVFHRVEGTEFVMENIEDCLRNAEDRRMDVRNLSIGVLHDGQWALLGLAEINIEKITKSSTELTKCTSKQEPETCAYFTTFRYKNPCKMMEADNEMWSTFFQNTVPPMRCPLKGLYSFEKAKMNGNAAYKGMPGLEGFYWKAKSTLLVGNKEVGCVIMEFSTM